MPILRRKLSAVHRDFTLEISRLRKFDSENQRAFSAYPSGRLTRKQLHFLVESVYFACFRAYEGFLRDVFLLYCLEKPMSTGRKAKSYVKPRSFIHAEKLIQSDLRFLDWNDPSKLIDRAERYLENGFPLKDPIVFRLDKLREYKWIRNHIAHSSEDSQRQYENVLRKYFTTIPLNIPTPGEFLLMPDKADPTKYLLLTFFDTLQGLANDLT